MHMAAAQLRAVVGLLSWAGLGMPCTTAEHMSVQLATILILTHACKCLGMGMTCRIEGRHSLTTASSALCLQQLNLLTAKWA